MSSEQEPTAEAMEAFAARMEYWATEKPQQWPHDPAVTRRVAQLARADAQRIRDGRHRNEKVLDVAELLARLDFMSDRALSPLYKLRVPGAVNGMPGKRARLIIRRFLEMQMGVPADPESAE